MPGRDCMTLNMKQRATEHKAVPIPTLQFEQSYWQAGYPLVAGIDEAGRGAWAGPVVAAAVILPATEDDLCAKLREVRDSKCMTALEREFWRIEITACAVSWSVGSASPEEIDRLNILEATRLAMTRALEGLYRTPDALLLDAVLLRELETSQTALIHGDQISLSIAAASIIAKTERDRMMRELDREYPGYGFSRHKGYGTRAHQNALATHGACALHRHSYRPILRIEAT